MGWPGMGWGGRREEVEHRKQGWAETPPRVRDRGCSSELDRCGTCCMPGYVPRLDRAGGALGRGPGQRRGKGLAEGMRGHTGAGPPSLPPSLPRPSPQHITSARTDLPSLLLFSASHDCSEKAGSSEQPPEPGGLGVTWVWTVTVECILWLSQSNWLSGAGPRASSLSWVWSKNDLSGRRAPVGVPSAPPPTVSA